MTAQMTDFMRHTPKSQVTHHNTHLDRVNHVHTEQTIAHRTPHGHTDCGPEGCTTSMTMIQLMRPLLVPMILHTKG